MSRIMIGLSYSGSTSDFDSDCDGSIPSGPATLKAIVWVLVPASQPSRKDKYERDE